MPKQNKYNFHELTSLGDSITLPRGCYNIARIRTAASNYGRRHGVWLEVSNVPDGIRIVRIAVPPSDKIGDRDSLSSRVRRIEDGVRFLCVTMIQIKNLLEEK
jgi:hypothetical protein